MQVVGQVQIEHVGRWIEHPQHTIDGEGLSAGPALQSLGENHLEDVAGRDVFLGPSHRRLKISLAEVGGQLTALPAAVALKGRQWLTEPFHQGLDAGHRAFVGLGHVTIEMSVGHHQQPVLDVIEDHQGVSQQEDGLGQLEAGRGWDCGLQFRLEEAHHIVGQVAHRPTVEAGQARDGDGLTGAQQLLDQVERVPPLESLHLHALLARDQRLLAAGDDGGRRVNADEGVAAYPLRLLHALQEKRRSPAAKLDVHRGRRLQIRRQFPVDGNHVALGAEFLGLL